MKQIIRNFKQITILFLAISLLGCEEENVTLPKVEANFTYVFNQDTGLVTFLNISENAQSYQWSFGDGNASTEINPFNMYTDGTYTVSLKALNVAGATSTFEQEIVIKIPVKPTFPLTFDSATVEYGATTFQGATFEIVDNPALTGSNAVASKVGKLINSGAAYEGVSFTLGAPIDLGTLKTLTMDFWSDKPVTVLLKLEISENDATEVSVSHGGTGWEKLTFTFTASKKYSKVVIFADGPGTSSGTFYFDNILQLQTNPIPCDAETSQSLNAADFNLTFMSDPTAKITSDGAGFVWTNNPNAEDALNKSCKVGQINRNGASLYANNQINLDAKIDFNANSGFKMKVITPKAATKILLKLEDKAAAGTNKEVSVVTTKVNEWEELTFNFTSADSGKFDKIVLFFELATNTTETYYIDDFKLVAGGGTPSCTETLLKLPINFDCDGIDYKSKDSGDVAFEVIANPEKSGINNKDTKVAKLVFDANQQWENMNLKLDTPVNFATDKVIKFKFFSSSARTLKLKLETGGAPTETDVAHTGSGWEELSFTMNTAASFSNFVLFVDGGANTNGTFYIDDIQQVAAVVACTDTMLKLPINFDCSTLDYKSKDTGDVAFEVIDNPEKSGINSKDTKVAKLVFDANQQWENMNLNLDTPVNFATDKVIKFKFFSSSARTLKLKLETGGAPTETDVAHTGSGWEELSFTMNTTASYSNFVLFVDGGTDTNGTFYIDDIQQMAAGGGGTTCPAPPAGDLISNGDFEAGEGCWQLINNGGETTISNTESNGGGSKSAQIKTAPAKNPGVKQERFGAGTVLPATSYTVKFDIKATVGLADGAVFQAFVFSEGAEGGATGATQHVLVQGLGNVSTSWETKTYTFTSGGAAPNVAGGFSFLAELVCGGAGTCKGTIVLDNVSIKKTP